MSSINVDRRNVRTCLEQHFVVPTYQRDYKWDKKHLEELLTDIQSDFLNSYENGHGRKDVGDYPAYFLGTIITTSAASGARAIVDGQQRLTTLLLLMAYFQRKRKELPSLNISDMGAMLRREVYGKAEFNIEFDKDREQFFSLLLSEPSTVSEESLDAKLDDIKDITAGTARLRTLYENIDNYLNEQIRVDLLAFFADFVTERVFLFDISVPSEQDGHKVFVTMNDRGLRLGPIDLLKGYLLSNISNLDMNGTANGEWTDCVRQLQQLGSDEDSAFFKTFLRAQFAETTRGKSKGDAPGDFENIGDAYHRWVIDNSKRVGLGNSDDFFDFVSNVIPRFISYYKKVKAAERTFSDDLRHIYYNGAKGLTLQTMAILAAIDPKDLASEVEKKMRVVGFFMDYLASSRTINRRDNNYDNIRDYVFGLCKRIRRKSMAELTELIRTEIANLDINPFKLDYVYYGVSKRQDLLHILARLAEHLEEGVEQTNKVGFPGYIQRSRSSKAFDIEHVIPHGEAQLTTTEAGTTLHLPDLDVKRNSIGFLVLLPRGKNRSLQDKGYEDKLPVYAGDNVLAASLTVGFYLNNPQVEDFKVTAGIDLAPIAMFDVAAGDARRALYERLAQRVWNVDNLETLV